MSYMRDFINIKEQRQLYYEPICQKDTKEGDKEIHEFRVGLGQCKIRLRHG